VARGADLHAKDANGSTVLHYVCTKRKRKKGVEIVYEEGHHLKTVEVIKYLLGLGVNLNELNEKNMSPLYVAVNYELLSIAEFLLECGALIDIQRKGTYISMYLLYIYICVCSFY
jgi:ankyrin repeat protein